MPELPDILAYAHALRSRIVGQPLRRLFLINPFLLRSVEPPLDEFVGREVAGVRHMGKRLVFDFGDEMFLVWHLMIAGRLHWYGSAKSGGRRGLVQLTFPSGRLVLTEAGSKRRASLRAVRGLGRLEEHDPGGLDVLGADPLIFDAALTRETHTLKRTLTDPHIFAGIGNAYSDEILHAARLSPFRLSTQLDAEQRRQLREACIDVLTTWINRLQSESAQDFPEHVTAFRPEMAVHGRFGQPCPRCATPIQRIVYAENEANYCPTCQTGGRLLADRALSRLLREDWPRTLDELEARKRAARLPSPSPTR